MRDTAEVYLQVRSLPASCQPAWVVRHDGATLIALDYRTTRRQAVAWVADNLTVAEMNAYRDAYEEPHVGQPLSAKWEDEELVPTEIPDSLRLPMCPQSLDYDVERVTRPSRTVRSSVKVHQGNRA